MASEAVSASRQGPPTGRFATASIARKEVHMKMAKVIVQRTIEQVVKRKLIRGRRATYRWQLQG